MSGATAAGAALAASLALAAAAGVAAAGSADRSVDPAVDRGGPDTSRLVGRAAAGWLKLQWAAYRARFVSPDGRVVDNANGGVSHSEGQGYGLLLAVAADDPEGFARLWHWTLDHLALRDDALFAWRWDPQRGAADLNDASDGDLLIAWALARGAERFHRPDYAAAARRIAAALAAAAVRPGSSGSSGPILLPAAAGFDAAAQPDGPVVNPSYWVFPALSALDALAPAGGWRELRQSGFAVIAASRFGPLGLPADWVSLAGPRPAPARRGPAAFGYDAIRVPLYLAWDAETPPELMAPFAALPAEDEPRVIAVSTGAPGAPMGGAGYRAVLALARCAARGETVPPELMAAPDPLYFPETLRLLAISVVQERYPRCL